MKIYKITIRSPDLPINDEIIFTERAKIKVVIQEDWLYKEILIYPQESL